MKRNQKIEEALSIVFEARENKSDGIDVIRKCILEKLCEDILQELQKEDLVTLEKGTVKFTKKGEIEARSVVRRQRLAERLLIDVLELGRNEMDSSACEFEHILSKEVEESICTLLGHPKECPHGLPIPSGDCCAKAKGHIESVVVPLTRLSPGESGKLVYVLTRKHPQLHRLMSFGIVPGARVTVHQVFPSFVINIEETQLALEEEIAKNIFVKKVQT